MNSTLLRATSRITIVAITVTVPSTALRAASHRDACVENLQGSEGEDVAIRERKPDVDEAE